MDEIAAQAMSNMAIVLQSYLPQVTPNIDRSLTMIPSKVKPTGVGGYVGINVVPNASLYGRVIEASSEITVVSSNGIEALQQAVSTITQALLSQDRSTLRSNGIFNINLASLSDISHSGRGGNAVDTRTAVLNVQFEYIPAPANPEGTIDEIVDNLELGLAEGLAEFYNLDFASLDEAGDDPLSYFDFVDDPGVVAASPVGNWVFDGGAGSIIQDRNVRGGGATTATAKKAGAQALVKQDGNPYLSRNLILKADMNSAEIDGIGFVFRWLDNDNFYYYLMSARHNYHLLAKKVAGSYLFLGTDGLNETVGYESDQPMEAKLIIENDQIKVYLNNKFIVAGSDSSIDKAGRVGFLTHRNTAARFFNISLTDFSV